MIKCYRKACEEISPLRRVKKKLLCEGCVKELDIARRSWPEKMTVKGFDQKFEEFLNTPKGLFLGVGSLTKDTSRSDTLT